MSHKAESGPPMSHKDFGPEAAFLHKLKGQKVCLTEIGNSDEFFQGRLLWVDKYSLCLRLKASPRDTGPRELMLYKAGIATIERQEYDETLGDETKDERTGTPTPT